MILYGQMPDSDSFDVEEEILKIRELFNEYGCLSLRSDFTKLEGDGECYIDKDGSIKALVLKKGQGTSTKKDDYSRYYYFKDGDLFFAYLEGNDSHRLYFKDGLMFRWRYCPNAQDSGNYVDHDLEGTDEFYYWQDYSYREIRDSIGERLQMEKMPEDRQHAS